jgi:transcriptional regulator with XRE-family HTH domain
MNVKLKVVILERFSRQADFAEAAGIDESRISRIIRERVSPTPTQRKKISEALNIPENDLFLLATKARA